MSQNTQVFLFVGGVGLGVLGMATYLVEQRLLDPSTFNTLAGMLIGGVVGLLAPSPIAKP